MTGNKRTILVVDDDRLNMKLAADLLEMNGFSVLKAVDGETAFEVLKTNKPDLVLLDIQLPGIDGYQVLKWIRQNKELDPVKVVAFTAAVMKEDEETIMRTGFDGLIRKPIDTKDFINRIKSFIAEDKTRTVSGGTGGKARAANTKILVVDDDEEICKVLKELLSREGYGVDIALSGKEAIAKAKSKYNIILIDAVMPEMGGDEICKEIMKVSPESIPILMTGKIDRDISGMERKFVEAGGRLYNLYKPFGPDEVQKVLRKALAENADR
ncbi:MAG: response regulator [Candidatus Omnitrophota bacterium]